jgi:hypothetical protein
MKKSQITKLVGRSFKSSKELGKKSCKITLHISQIKIRISRNRMKGGVDYQVILDTLNRKV